MQVNKAFASNHLIYAFVVNANCIIAASTQRSKIVSEIRRMDMLQKIVAQCEKK